MDRRSLPIVTDAPDAPEAPSEAPAARAPEDLAAALRFLHLLATQQQARTAELSASLYALLETLIAEGRLPLDAYEKRRELTVARENERTRAEPGVSVYDVPDKYALTALPDIDCAALLPLCRARCCHLPFPLSVQDLDERVVRWDYGRPYMIARRADGSCVHNEGGRCGVYQHRPAVCRVYDCRKDGRIWQDFAARIPAEP
ncbi:MAG: YkgJ family cysteine cluster protein [Polyangiaceae bacterium]|nr:YkgJ family cysteine cluster protein [Polyangiaceae bacterium]